MSVTNLAPWITTDGAGTIDRNFPAVVILGNGRKLTGVSLYSGSPGRKKFLAPPLPLVSLSIHDLMTGFCKTGMVGETAILLQDMLLKGMCPDVEVYNILLQGYCRSKNFRKVLELLGCLIRKSIHISTLSYRNLESLVMIVDTVLKELQERELLLDEATYNFVVYGFSCCKSVSRARHYLSSMMSKDIRPSNRCSTAVIKCLCRDGDIKTA